MGVRTEVYKSHPSSKPTKGILIDWFQSGGHITATLSDGQVRTSPVVRRYRIGKDLFVETVNSIYQLRFGLRWGRKRHP